MVIPVPWKRLVWAITNSDLLMRDNPAILICIASTPDTQEVLRACTPALLAQGFRSSSYAPASPWRSGLPAIAIVEVNPRMAMHRFTIALFILNLSYNSWFYTIAQCLFITL
jgi:hypothetical protein